jgi:hypothetical protein
MSDARVAQRRPDFLLIGEAKCGTTTLWQILSRHPRVFFPQEKELHFFSSYAAFPQHGRLETGGLEAYLHHFAPAEDDQVCGEATPNYLFDVGACDRIESVVPGARLVVILRDPVARAWSHYWHQVRRGRERLGFEEALAAEDQRLARGDLDEESHFSYRSRGRYIEGLRRYERRFSREQLCVVFMEDLRSDPDTVTRRVCAHLGLASVEPAAAAALPHANRARYPRWPRLDAFTRSLRSRAEALGPGAGRAVRAIGRATRALRVYSGQPRMADTTRQDLRRAFAGSDTQLEEWLGRPVPWAESERSAAPPR